MRLPPSASLKRPRVNARRYASELSNKLDAKNTTWESDSVTKAAQEAARRVRDAPDQDRSELFAELARRVALARTTCRKTTIWWRSPITCLPNSIIASRLNDITAPRRGLVGGSRMAAKVRPALVISNPG